MKRVAEVLAHPWGPETTPPPPVLSTNTIRELRFVRKGEKHTGHDSKSGFWSEPAPEDGYDVSLADSFVFIPASLLRRARRRVDRREPR